MRAEAPVALPENRHLVPGRIVGHQIAGRPPEPPGDLDQHRHARDHLEALDLLDGAGRDGAPAGELLEGQAGLLPPLPDPSSDPGDLGVHRVATGTRAHRAISGVTIR